MSDGTADWNTVTTDDVIYHQIQLDSPAVFEELGISNMAKYGSVWHAMSVADRTAEGLF